ncbi:hypothetical protein C8R44DRAFT_875580 [Mycena epipterygia]|nr:hypothetical protein C8R44DRAFT_875580 [Mycena epipterygia]
MDQSTGDWKTHKTQCRGAPQVQSPHHLKQLLRMAAKNTIHEDSVALGLDPALISGTKGAELYARKDGSESFWRLDVSVREIWEVKARKHNSECRSFWVDTFAPISIDPQWVDVVLDAVLNLRVPCGNDPKRQDEIYTLILAALFPHLARFTPAQNTALLDILTSSVWCPDGVFRLGNATEILFGHGQPSEDLITQLLARCIGSVPPPYMQVNMLLEYVALPIQTYWPTIAGTRILDTALSMFHFPDEPPVPVDKIYLIANTSPEACKHLLPAVTTICMHGLIEDAGTALLDLFEAFGVTFAEGGRQEVFLWLFLECTVHDSTNKEGLEKFLARRGKGAPLVIEAKEYSTEEYRELVRAAQGRLGNPDL